MSASRDLNDVAVPVVDDLEDNLDSIEDFLEDEVWSVHRAASGDPVIRLLEKRTGAFPDRAASPEGLLELLNEIQDAAANPAPAGTADLTEPSGATVPAPPIGPPGSRCS